MDGRIEYWNDDFAQLEVATQTGCEDRETVKNAHNYYINWSWPRRVRDLLPDKAEGLMQHLLTVIQVWPPFVACWKSNSWRPVMAGPLRKVT